MWSASGNGATKVGGPIVEGGCARCGKRVYEAEKKIAVSRVSV